jgi:hypothetical protein
MLRLRAIFTNVSIWDTRDNTLAPPRAHSVMKPERRPSYWSGAVVEVASWYAATSGSESRLRGEIFHHLLPFLLGNSVDRICGFEQVLLIEDLIAWMG